MDNDSSIGFDGNNIKGWKRLLELEGQSDNDFFIDEVNMRVTPGSRR